MADDTKVDPPEDDDTKVDPPEDDEDDSGDDDDTPDEFKPPTEDEWKKVQAALKRAKKQAANLRVAKKDDPPKDDKKNDEPKTDPDARLKRVAGIGALMSEGLTRPQAKVALRLIDLSGVDLDDDGDADFDDAIEDLRETFPAIFSTGEDKKTPGARVKTSGGRRSGGEPSTADDKMTRKMLQSAGYRT